MKGGGEGVSCGVGGDVVVECGVAGDGVEDVARAAGSQPGATVVEQ
jgi:hypothetical protein